MSVVQREPKMLMKESQTVPWVNLCSSFHQIQNQNAENVELKIKFKKQYSIVRLAFVAQQHKRCWKLNMTCCWFNEFLSYRQFECNQDNEQIANNVFFHFLETIWNASLYGSIYSTPYSPKTTVSHPPLISPRHTWDASCCLSAIHQQASPARTISLS